MMGAQWRSDPMSRRSGTEPCLIAILSASEGTPSTPTSADDVLHHLSTSVVGGVDGVRPCPTLARYSPTGGHERRSRWAASPRTNRRRAAASACAIASPIARRWRSAASRQCAKRGCTSRWSRCPSRRATTSTRPRRGFLSGCSPTAGCDPSSADLEALVLHDARARVEESRRSGLGGQGDLVDTSL